MHGLLDKHLGEHLQERGSQSCGQSVHARRLPITLGHCHKHTHICSQTDQSRAQHQVVLSEWLLSGAVYGDVTLTLRGPQTKEQLGGP